MNLCQLRIWAAARHGNQKYGAHPYSYHLNKVEGVAIRFGFNDQDLLSACHTHDLIEDTNTTAQDMHDAGINPRVIRITENLTDEPGANRQEKKAKTLPKIAADPDSILAKLFDRIANVEEGMATGNTKTLSRHVEEYREFKKALYKAEHLEAQALWQHLDELLSAV